MREKQYKVSVDQNQDFALSEGEGQCLDVIAGKNPDEWHVLLEHSGYHVKVLGHEAGARSLQVLVNQKIFQVKIADEHDALVHEMGFSAAKSQKVSELRAPMPGLVLDLLIEAGNSVQAGDPLLILEAMKMENIIKSAGDGRVAIIHVAKGTAVEKGQLLLEMD